MSEESVRMDKLDARLDDTSKSRTQLSKRIDRQGEMLTDLQCRLSALEAEKKHE